MTMPPTEIDIILKRLDQIEADRKHDTERLHDKLDKITRDGCAKAESHATTQHEHEKRIRAVETYQARQTGQVAAVAGVISFGSAILIAIGKALLTKIGGN